MPPCFLCSAVVGVDTASCSFTCSVGGGGAALSASDAAALQLGSNGGAAAIFRPPVQPSCSHHHFRWAAFDVLLLWLQLLSGVMHSWLLGCLLQMVPPPDIFCSFHLPSLSVTAILIFGEIVPQAVCKRYGLQASAFWAISVSVALL